MNFNWFFWLHKCGLTGWLHIHMYRIYLYILIFQLRCWVWIFRIILMTSFFFWRRSPYAFKCRLFFFYHYCYCWPSLTSLTQPYIDIKFLRFSSCNCCTYNTQPETQNFWLTRVVTYSEPKVSDLSSIIYT